MKKDVVSTVFIYLLLLAIFPKIICSLTISALLFVIFFYERTEIIDSLFNMDRKMLSIFIIFIISFSAVIFLALSNSFL